VGIVFRQEEGGLQAEPLQFGDRIVELTVQTIVIGQADRAPRAIRPNNDRLEM
jgi:hypothetical protein